MRRARMAITQVAITPAADLFAFGFMQAPDTPPFPLELVVISSAYHMYQ